MNDPISQQPSLSLAKNVGYLGEMKPNNQTFILSKRIIALDGQFAHNRINLYVS